MSKVPEENKMIKIITGQNDFQRSLALQLTISEFSLEYGDLSIERLDAQEAEYEDIYNSITSLPFLVNKKLIILIEPSKNKEFVEKISEINNLVSDSIDVIIYEPNLDKRSTYYKTLKKMPNYQEYPVLGPNELTSWILKYVSDSASKISYSDANLLIDRVGSNQLTIMNELDKMLLYTTNIDKKVIEAMTDSIPNSTIFQLLDSAFRGDQKSVIKLYDQQKQQKVDAAQIMALIIWQIHILAVIKSSGSTNSSSISRSSKISYNIVEKGLRLLSQIDSNELLEIINKAQKLDIQLKTTSIDQDEAVLYFLITIRK